MVRFKRKHKTLTEAKKELIKANSGWDKGYKIFKTKAPVWKFVVANDVEWLNGMY